MSVRIMTAAWAVDLPAGEKLVLLALADCANDEGKCWPGLTSLARKTGKSRRSLIDSIHALEKSGHLSRDVLVGKGVNYTIHPQDQAELPLDSGAKSAPVQKQHRCKNTYPSGAKSAPKPSGTVRGSEAKASSPKPAKFILPADIPAEPWADYEDMRNRNGKRMTDKARSLAVTRLRKLRDEDGWPPGDVLNNSTLNSYQGLFPPKDDRHGRTQQQSSLRGTRPDPALDLLRAARAAEAAERESGADYRRAGASLPALGRG